jgi:isoleucyl-tRNA synthetase
VNARAAGPRLGKTVQQVIMAARAGDWAVHGETVVAGGIRLEPAEYELTLEVADAGEERSIALLPAPTRTAATSQGDASEPARGAPGGFVLLHTQTTPELEREGVVRDLIRDVQEERKRAGLDVSDRIRLSLTLPAQAHAAVDDFADLLRDETLAVELQLAEGPEAIEVVRA